MQLQTPKRYYTPEEYLALEESAEFKSEYRDGVQHTKINDRKWLLTEYESEVVLVLSSIEVKIDVNEIYERVNFAEGED